MRPYQLLGVLFNLDDVALIDDVCVVNEFPTMRVCFKFGIAPQLFADPMLRVMENERAKLVAAWKGEDKSSHVDVLVNALKSIARMVAKDDSAFVLLQFREAQAIALAALERVK